MGAHGFTKVGCGVFMCTVCNFLRVCLIAFLHFGFVYVLGCLPYFFQLFCAFLHVFFWSNFTDSLFLYFALFSVVSHPRLQCLSVSSICFFLCRINILLSFLGLDVYFVVLKYFFAVFLLSSVIVFLLHKSVVMHQFALARFALFYYYMTIMRYNIFATL